VLRAEPSVTSIPAWQAERTERVSRAVDVIGLAYRLLGTVKRVSVWLTSPNPDLSRRRPCDLTFSERGTDLVSALLRHQLATIQSALALADQVLGLSAEAWTTAPNPNLGGFTPRDLLRDPESTAVFEDLLRSIEAAKCGESP
jgi:uncharacterized protein (DUF2384 family)